MGIEEPIWTSVELAAACGAISARPWYADGVTTDSRCVFPGDLYIALEDESGQGHAGVAEALEKGAVAAVVSSAVEGMPIDDQRLVHVSDTEAALVMMAEHARERAPAKVVGVTGSFGKIDVVHALGRALAPVGPAHASSRKMAQNASVPLSLARMPRATRFGVLELGMNNPELFSTNIRLTRPDVAVVTSVDHPRRVLHPGNIQAVKNEAHLFGSLPKGGLVVLGVDNPYKNLLLDRVAQAGALAITVSVVGAADVRPVKMTEQENCTCLTADIFGTRVTYKIAQPGREWVLKSLLVMATVKALEADLGSAAITLAGLEAQTGRGRVHALDVGSGKASLIDESYNANPMATRSALRRLSILPNNVSGKKIAVLADSADSTKIDHEHALALAGDLKKFGINEVIAIGEQTGELAKLAGIQAEQWGAPNNMAEALHARLQNGDAVMIKGAAGVPMHQLVQDVLELGVDEDKPRPQVDRITVR